MKGLMGWAMRDLEDVFGRDELFESLLTEAAEEIKKLRAENAELRSLVNIPTDLGQRPGTLLAPPRAPTRVLRFTNNTKNPNEWHAYSGGLLVAVVRFENDRLYEPHCSWYMRGIVSAESGVMDTHGFENTLDEAKAAVVEAFKKWLAWAEL
jgi:hypothetical protein